MRVQKATIKQAKASFKSRNSNPLSEREQKQLERAVQLDRRAWAIREREKRHVEAMKKKQEKEHREREERIRAQLGSQRRTDKFGYKSSQFHLGAFFGAQNVKTKTEQIKVDEDDDFGDDGFGDEGFGDGGFGDDGVDDETLLGALTSFDQSRTVQHQQRVENAFSIPPRSEPLLQARVPPDETVLDDFDDFWDELGSSTQIARELALDNKPSAHVLVATANTNAKAAMSSLPCAAPSGWHISRSIERPAVDRKLMPPPALPLKTMQCAVKEAPAVQASPQRTPTSAVSFTLSELEGFVEDDLQLTQVGTG
jgi:hypothetical protein